MNGACVKAVRFQRLGDDIHIHLAVAEHNRIGAGLALRGDDRPQNRALFGKAFVFARGRELDQLLLDGGRGGGLTRHFDFDRTGQEGVGDAFNFGGHGRRVEEGLTGKGGQAEDPLDIGDKTHVEHAVGLVHHHDLHAGQQQFAALVVIEQAARGGDQHIDATVDQLVLFAKGHAANQQGLGQLGVFGINVKVFRHLRCKLAGGGQDQAAGHPRFGAAFAQQGDHWQRKAGGFASAGLSDAQNVFALQSVRDGLGLDRGWRFIAGFCHGLKHAGIQREI